MFGSLERLVFTAFSDANFNTQTGMPFTVWINPASYTHDYVVKYTDRQGPGSGGASPEFNKVGQETVSFDLIFDTTGVVPPPVPGTPIPSDGAAGLVDQLKSLLVTLKGGIHQPNYVKLSWAQLQFQCVLSSFNVVFSLFQPNGTPLRGKVAVKFLSFTSEKQLAEEDNLGSPDLSHMVMVVAGDTLPALCHRIYGSSGYYLKVAEYNGLNGFRRLQPGRQLLFPPLQGSAS